MPRCDIAGDKPQVWKDDDGWHCTQASICRTCGALSAGFLAEDTTWEKAMEAAKNGTTVDKEAFKPWLIQD